MKTMQRWHMGLMAGAITAVMVGMVGCGDSGSSSRPAALTAAESAGVAGSWSGTWTEGGDASTFAVAIDCAGNLTSTVTPSGGNAEPVTGIVTSWDATSGAFQANVTRGGESHTLTGVVNGSDLTGSFTTGAGATGNFVVTLSGATTICTAQQIADLGSGASVTADLTSTVDTSTSPCNGTGAAPYSGDVALLLKASASGGVDMVMSFAPTTTTALVGVVGATTDTGSELHFAGLGTTSGSSYLATLAITLLINGDGTLQGSFSGTVDADGNGDFTGANDCTAIAGTFSGGSLVP